MVSKNWSTPVAASLTRSSEPNPETEGGIPFLGSRLQIEVSRTPLPAGRVVEREGVLGVQVPASVAGRQLRKAVREAVERWLWAHARTHILGRVAELAPPMKVSYGTITIKETRSRWGSCSHVGNLNFNWRIIMAPPWVIDYLVVHELAHRREMNHSIHFWNVVSEICPDYRNHRTWLRHCGEALLSW